MAGRRKTSSNRVVELLQALVHRFIRGAAQVRRDAFEPPFELSLMEEAKARREKSDHRGGLVLSGGKRRRGARLVVVLQETRQLVLVIQSGVEMLAHRPGVAFAQAVVQPFVVSVIESLLLHRPLEVPIHFRHEAEVR